MKISRRSFLWGAAGIGNLRIPDVVRTYAQRSQGPCELIPRSDPPIAQEMPLSAANSWITPNDCFYLFNHGGFPKLNADNWNLVVDGEVETPLALNWQALNAFDEVEVINTLECAGNGRSFFRPRIEGVQWEYGAVGNAAFRGIRLRDILARAGIRKSASHVAFTGADNLDSGIGFVRSIPLNKALEPQSILATRMNGVSLSPEHGYPLRALIPGWIGAASVKRVMRISVLQHEAQGEYMEKMYRLPPRPSDHSGRTSAVTGLKIKSMIVTPLDGATLQHGPVAVRGFAWAGDGTVATVQVTADSGKSWRAARVGESRARFAWREWEYILPPIGLGTFTIAARATDTLGNTQPQYTSWNPRGYVWNAIQHVRIQIKS